MKNTILTILYLVFYLTLNAQKLTSCADCSTKKYSKSNFTDYELFEVELLRNEIFARHNYSFTNLRLEDYFLKFNWYKPNPNNPIKKVVLNEYEKHNVAVFKAVENEIKTKQKLIISKIEKLKTEINNQNHNYLKSIFVNENTKYDSSLVKIIGEILNTINLKQIHWHKGEALYAVQIDNGFFISTTELHINKNSISITRLPMNSHSVLMSNDAFEYPSAFFSEWEYMEGAEFTFKNGDIKLTRHLFAG